MSSLSTAGPTDVSIIPIPNALAVSVSRITVALAITPQQLPSLIIPAGLKLTIRAAADNGTKKIYIASSSADVLTSATRLVLAKGDVVSLQIVNADVLWVGASANNADIELITEL